MRKSRPDTRIKNCNSLPHVVTAEQLTNYLLITLSQGKALKERQQINSRLAIPACYSSCSRADI